ncbi:MAG TPA: cupin domain-containing protein [Clostridiaceae bacterium]|nr:cupin domain-containing protein [Clostridiaceae bacterium]
MQVRKPEDLEQEVRPDGLIMTGLYRAPDLGFEMGLAVFPPGGHSLPAAHEHHEYSYILSGALKVIVGEEEFYLQEGMSCNIPAGEVHESINESDTACKLIWIFVSDN